MSRRFERDRKPKSMLLKVYCVGLFLKRPETKAVLQKGLRPEKRTRGEQKRVACVFSVFNGSNGISTCQRSLWCSISECTFGFARFWREHHGYTLFCPISSKQIPPTMSLVDHGVTVWFVHCVVSTGVRLFFFYIPVVTGGVSARVEAVDTQLSAGVDRRPRGGVKDVWWCWRGGLGGQRNRDCTSSFPPHCLREGVHMLKGRRPEG